MKLVSVAAIISLAVIVTAKPWNVVTAGSQSSESRDQTAEKQLMDLERKGYQEGLTSSALETGVLGLRRMGLGNMGREVSLGSAGQGCARQRR